MKSLLIKIIPLILIIISIILVISAIMTSRNKQINYLEQKYIDTSAIDIYYKDGVMNLTNKSGVKVNVAVENKTNKAFLDNFFEVNQGFVAKSSCKYLAVDLSRLKVDPLDENNYIYRMNCLNSIEELSKFPR